MRWFGPFNAAGKTDGRGVVVIEGGGTTEGEYVNGKMQGTWLRTRPDGTRLVRLYVDGVQISEEVRFTETRRRPCDRQARRESNSVGEVTVPTTKGCRDDGMVP
jgi:hypothetical protein